MMANVNILVLGVFILFLVVLILIDMNRYWLVENETTSDEDQEPSISLSIQKVHSEYHNSELDSLDREVMKLWCVHYNMYS